MELKEIVDRMHSGKLYYSDDEALMAVQAAALELQYDFNQTRPSEGERRTELLKQMLAEVGENCYVEPPLHCNWGGKHVHFGNNVYANFGLTIVDDTHVYVGNNVMFGPNVILCTGTHPICPPLRRKVAQYNLPVRIGDNVWLGGNVTVLPGVTIGENSVIGAGSVVTHDIPANVVAAGTPCRVLRPIAQRDLEFYNGDCVIDIE